MPLARSRYYNRSIYSDRKPPTFFYVTSFQKSPKGEILCPYLVKTIILFKLEGSNLCCAFFSAMWNSPMHSFISKVKKSNMFFGEQTSVVLSADLKRKYLIYASSF